jgi:hypothetical protein
MKGGKFMFCGKCSESIRDDSDFCQFCGIKVIKDKTDSLNPNATKDIVTGIPSNHCRNHPDREVLGVCKYCGYSYCFDCLVDAQNGFYCKNEECRKKYQMEIAPLNSSLEGSEMNKRDIAKLVCKIFGISIVLTIAETFSNLFNIYLRNPLGLIPIVLLAILGFLLFLRPNPISRYIVSDEDHPNEKLIWAYKDVERIVFSAIGLYILAIAIPAIIGTILQLLQEVYMNHLYQTNNDRILLRVNSLIQYLLRAGIGLWLLLGFKGLIKFLNKYRDVDT